MQVQLEDQFYKRQRETHLVRGGQDLRAVCFNKHHPLFQCHLHYNIPSFKPWRILMNQLKMFGYIYKVAHTYIRFYICEDYIVVVIYNSVIFPGMSPNIAAPSQTKWKKI